MVITLTNENINEIINKKDKPIIIDIFATWCGPCIQMKPIFEGLAKELSDKYVFAELNVDDVREVAIDFNVTMIPTFLFIKEGKIVGRETGYASKQNFKKYIEEYLE